MVFQDMMEKIGSRIVKYLDEPITGYTPFFAPSVEVLERALQPGDVLLIEGNTRIASIIKYLTQSTWSHSCIYVGDALPPDPATGEPRVLVEALAYEGVIGVPLSKYARFNTRICRPVGLSAAERARVVDFCVSYLGRQYDLKYILDLIRFLVPYPPVPVKMRRQMLALGHGDPTRAVCSTMIAEAFHAIGYPILPDTELHSQSSTEAYDVSPYVEHEAVIIRRDGLFTPRDFDISPFFQVVKPTIEGGFDFHVWPLAHRRSFDAAAAIKSMAEGVRNMARGKKAQIERAAAQQMVEEVEAAEATQRRSDPVPPPRRD